MIRGLTRRYFVSLHKWLALILGVWFVLVGITGSILVFDYEIDSYLNKSLAHQCKDSIDSKISFENILQKAKDQVPNYVPQYLGIPYGRDVVRVFFDDPEPSLLEVSLSRCSGDVLVTRDFGSTFVRIVYQIHAKLVAGDVGRVIVGILGILFSISLISGIFLWWPGRKHFHKSFMIKWNSSLWKLLYDTHRVLGAFSAIFLLVLVFTGVCLSFPEFTRNSIARALPIIEHSHGVEENVSKVNLDEALSVAKSKFPNSSLMGIKLPGSDQHSLQFIFRQSGEPMKYTGHTVVTINSENTVSHVIDAENLPSGELALSWIFPLHTGEAFNLPGRVVACVLGVFPLVLMITGIWIWLKKRTLRSKRSL